MPSRSAPPTAGASPDAPASTQPRELAEPAPEPASRRFPLPFLDYLVGILSESEWQLLRMETASRLFHGLGFLGVN